MDASNSPDVVAEASAAARVRPESAAEVSPASSRDVSRAATNLFLMINSLETGGSERQFTVLAQNLQPSRFQTYLGCVSPLGPLARHFSDIPAFPLGGSLFKWQSLRTRFKLARHLRRNRVQVAHAFDFYTNLLMIPAAKVARIPAVIGSQRQLGDLLTNSQFRVQVQAFRLCDAIVCNSHAAADRLISAGVNKRKIAVIGNALLSEAFAVASPALPKGEGTLRVGMVARMNHAYKNQSGFLRIAAAIHRRVPEVEFVLVGDGPLRKELEQEASTRGLGSSAIFMGDRQDMPAVLASLDVAVNTSDSESLSNVILEAMAAGLPAVAYDVGGNRELLGSDRGELIPAGNETAFAERLLELLADPERRQKLGGNARKFAQQTFGLEAVIGQYENLYWSVLQKKRKGNSAA